MHGHYLPGSLFIGVMLLAACSDGNPPTLPEASSGPAMLDSHNAVDGASFGFTDGWFDGRTVQFFYHKPFFCRTPVEDGQPVGSTSDCEVGSDGTVDPRPGNIPVLYVMIPLGFRPDASTLHCPIVGQCISHPSTIDLSRLVGTLRHGQGEMLVPRAGPGLFVALLGGALVMIGPVVELARDKRPR